MGRKSSQNRIPAPWAQANGLFHFRCAMGMKEGLCPWGLGVVFSPEHNFFPSVACSYFLNGTERPFSLMKHKNGLYLARRALPKP